MYSMSEKPDMEVTVSRERTLAERAEEMELKLKVQQSMLKTLRQACTVKMSSQMDRIKSLRQTNIEKRTLMLKLAEKQHLVQPYVSSGSPGVVNFLNQMRYEKVQKEQELRDVHGELVRMRRITRPNTAWDVKQREEEHRSVILENRVEEMKLKQDMAYVVGSYYKEIHKKFEQDHFKFPGRIQDLEKELFELKQDLAYLKEAKKLAVKDKNRLLRLLRKLHERIGIERVQRKVQQEKVIRDLRHIREQRVVFPPSQGVRHRRKSMNDQSFYANSLRVLELHEGFDKILKTIPGATLDTVVSRIITQDCLKIKLKRKIDELHEVENNLYGDIDRLKQHFEACKFGGWEELCKNDGYKKELEESVLEEFDSLDNTKDLLNYKSQMKADFRAALQSLLDKMNCAANVRIKKYSKGNILCLFDECCEAADRLVQETEGAEPADYDEIRAPGFLEFLESELNKGNEEDEVQNILKRHSQKKEEEPEMHKDSSIDLEEFRNALKTKSVKLYLSKCKRSDRHKGVPASMIFKGMSKIRLGKP